MRTIVLSGALAGGKMLSLMRSVQSVMPPAMARPDDSTDALRRRAPRSGEWELVAVWPGGTRWLNVSHRISVLSSVSNVDEPDPGPQWHVSVALVDALGAPAVAPDAAVKLVRENFDMLAAEEDNHVPNGRVRNLWLPIRTALVGVPCSCKAEEEPHEGEGGYVWRDVPAQKP